MAEETKVEETTEQTIEQTAEKTTDETATEVETEETRQEAAEEVVEETVGEETTETVSEDVKESEQEKASEKKGPFKKKEKKKDKKDEMIEDLTDKVKRQMAEFDNFRKRTEKEKSQMYEIGAKSIIEKILPVVDNFERGLAAVPEEKHTEDPFVDGMDKVYKQLMTMLAEADVKPIEAVGQEFDPNLHNAVMQVESEEFESGVIAQELQKGYMYRDTVVRHSMVAVVS